LERIRQGAIRKTQENLPSPVSELLLGMTIGVDHFGNLPKFKNMLLKTGTIHVVVVSGYNISLVYSMVNIFLGSFYDKSKLILGIIVAFFYSLISGFDPPVIRSWIMGTIAYLGKYYGRSFPTLRVLFVSALFMLVWKPLFLFSLSFQLSFMATLSLILFSDWVKSLSFVSKIPLLFREDFIATFSAQILVWPLISIYFGRVSLISILVNTLVLWTVPLATVLGGVFLLTSFLGDFLFIPRILAFFVYIPMNFFTNIIVFFSSFKFAEIDFSFSIIGFCAYYLVVTLLFRKVIFTNANVK
jgi:competence protein ComEC